MALSTKVFKVLGLDPSLRNWGIAQCKYSEDLGLHDMSVSLIHTDPVKEKMPKNHKDLASAFDIATEIKQFIKHTDIVLVEAPVGSQSSRAMASYGIVMGLLGAIKASGLPMIIVTPRDVKKALTNNPEASKNQMIDKAFKLWPGAGWPLHKSRGLSVPIASKSEHMADAIGALYAGLKNPEFKKLIKE